MPLFRLFGEEEEESPTGHRVFNPTGLDLNRIQARGSEPIDVPWTRGQVAQIPALSTMDQVGSFGVSLVPFAKYLLPQEQEAWQDMDDGEKARSIAWEVFGAATILGGGLIMRFGGAGLNKMQKFLKARSMLKVRPMEEMLEQIGNAEGKWRAFDYQTKVESTLKNTYHFANDEAIEIGKVVAAGVDPVSLKALQWDKGDKVSKAWKTLMKPKSGTPYGGPTLSAELSKELTPEKMRFAHYKKLYYDNLRATHTGVNFPHITEIARFQVGKLYGDDVAKQFDLGTVTDDFMANLIGSVFEPAGNRAVTAGHRLAMGEFKLPFIHPVEEVYGMGEATFQTKTKIYDVFSEALNSSNIYRTDKLNTLMRKLVDEGFGKIEKGKFVPNAKAFTAENLADAYATLKKIDRIAEGGRKGSLVRAEAKKVIDELVLETQERAPLVGRIVEVVRDYADVLYKDMASKYPLGIFNKIDALTPEGREAVQLIASNWGIELDKLFSATGGNTYQRVRGVRKMLREYKNLLKNPEKLFSLKGKELKEVVEEVSGRLSYGGEAQGAFPLYLEGYMPRVAMRGISFENNWHTTLTGKATAGFMKHREQVEQAPLVSSLQEMLEHRTSAQAKQLFFYDEVDKAVKYAQTLPDEWKKHVDFTLGRILGRPSKWDEHLATLIERVSGGRVAMDPYRAMKAAKTVTGMAYSGMLGLRPFAAFRNLTQPIIMVPAELGGGIRDSASLISGLGRAISKEHREYIKSIGAIKEFLPDQEFGAMLPRTGKFKVYNNLEDAFMYMFRISDRFNRYWTGGAAVDKWDNAMKVVGTENLKLFAQKVGLNNRQPWVRKEIERMLEADKFDEAKAVFVKNIIDKSQYLYGALDMPTLTGTGGAQKLATMFNSWWMNYASSVSRWAMTGDADVRAKRMITFVMTSAMAEQMLELYAGPGSARRSMFFGPLPLGDIGMPPAMKPLWHMLKMTKDFGESAVFFDAEKRQDAVNEFQKAIRAASYFAPGGLALHQIAKGLRDNRNPVAAWGQYKPEEYEALWGLLKR